MENLELEERILKRVKEELKAQIRYEILDDIHQIEPDLMINFQETYKETTQMIKQFQSDFLHIHKKMNKVVNSPSLYQDVYRMRDEIIEIKKLLHNIGK